jgi:hypothetical protein
MPMTTVNARIYIARVIGGAASPNAIDAADEALRRGYSDWQTMRNWDFLLKDNSLATAVSATVTKSSAVVAAPSTGAFDFVNSGQSVTYSGALGTLAASTTILSLVRGTDGVITSITLSNAFAGGVYTTEAGTLTFGAYIHVTGGTNDYSLPLDCFEPYSARFITNSKRPLMYKNQRVWDRMQWDQTVHGTPAEYTSYSPYSAGTQNHGTEHLKFDVVPDQSDDLLLRYYRKFTVDGTYVDVHDKFLYAFLDYCRARALEAKRAQENPQQYLNEQKEQAEKSGESEEEKEDDDDNFMKSQYEQGSSNNRPIVGNGDFWPTQY